MSGPWDRDLPPPPPARPRGRFGLWLGLIAALGAIVLALARAFPEAVTTPQDWARVARAAGIVVLVSAGLARSGRVLRAEHLRYAAFWAGIVAVLALGFAYRDELAGVPRHLQLAFSTGEGVATADHELVIPQDEDGGFMVVGRVNGQRVRFMVDTGATDTVLSPDDARRIGVDVSSLRFIREAETANGLGYGAPFVADSMQVGPIAFPRFGMVVNQTPMSGSLLGMSFLGRLESFQVQGRKLILRWREADQRQP